jgi:hypothetical protein
MGLHGLFQGELYLYLTSFMISANMFVKFVMYILREPPMPVNFPGREDEPLGH